MNKFTVCEGTQATPVNEFDTLTKALNYIDNKYSEDNIIEQLVIIDVRDEDNNFVTSYTMQEIYDLLYGDEDYTPSAEDYAEWCGKGWLYE